MRFLTKVITKIRNLDVISNFNIVKFTLKKTNRLFLSFLSFKFFLLFFYVMSGYQDFTISTVRLILRLILSNDIIIIIFAAINIFITNRYGKSTKAKAVITAVSVASIVFSVLTFAFAFFILVIS